MPSCRGLYVEIRKTHKEESEKTAAAEREQQQLAANVRWDKLAESQRSKREQYAAELRKLDADRAADLISEAKYRQAKADLAKKYEEKASSAKPKKSDEEKERERQAKLDAEDWARRVYSSAWRPGWRRRPTPSGPRSMPRSRRARRLAKSRVEIEARTLALMNEQLKWRDALGLQDEETEQLKRNIAAQKSLMDAVRDTDSAKQAEAQAKPLLKPIAKPPKPPKPNGRKPSTASTRPSTTALSGCWKKARLTGKVSLTALPILSNRPSPTKSTR